MQAKKQRKGLGPDGLSRYARKVAARQDVAVVATSEPTRPPPAPASIKTPSQVWATIPARYSGWHQYTKPTTDHGEVLYLIPEYALKTKGVRLKAGDRILCEVAPAPPERLHRFVRAIITINP